MWVACESTVTVVTMTIIGAILSPMVVFTTGGCKTALGDLCLGFCSEGMNWSVKI